MANNSDNKKNALRNRIFRPMAILIGILSLLFACIGLFLNLKTEGEKRDINLQNTALMVSEMHVKDIVGKDDGVQRMNELISTLQGIDVVSVVDEDGIRVFHSNSELIGTEYDGIIPDFSQHGNQVYVENGNGPSGQQRRAYAPIYSDSGEYRGFVLAIELMKNIRTEITNTLIIYAVILAVILLMALYLSSRVSNKIKNTLMGYEPDVFSSMYHIRENILDATDEGIVGVDADGNIQFINRAASGLIDTEDNSIARLLEEPLRTGSKSLNKQININDRNIIVDCIPIKENEITVGAIAVMHDRTELANVMEELTGTKYLVDSMRANNHDFTNKLHVILGLIQMEMYDEAQHYIENITMVQRETISNIMNKIDDPTIAALLIGKLARASELNIKLNIDGNSSYHSSDVYLPSGVMVTVLGNLIENAFEAMDRAIGQTSDNNGFETSAGKQMDIFIISEPNNLYIKVEDNGPGMTDETKSHIFDLGYSTKGQNRGTGLYQVKKIIAGAGGNIEVVSELGKGTAFIIRIGGEKHV